MTSQTAAASHLKSLMDALNADFRWSNGLLDIVPYGDVAVTGNGYTFTPNNTPVYALNRDDFLPNQGSLGSGQASGAVTVAFSRADASQIANSLRVEYLDRANLYNPVTIYATDDAAITAQGRYRPSDLKQNHFFALASAASVSCALQLHRLRSTPNTYQVTLGRQFILLDVMDLVTITEPALQLSNQLCRITEIQENADSSLTVTLEEVPLTASAPIYTRQKSLGVARNVSIPPGSVNAPVIFELPGGASHALQVQIAASGSSPSTWGGCHVWLSADGTNYEIIGSISAPARMGTLTANLPTVSTTPSGPTADNTNTLAITLAASGGSLISVSSADLNSYSTLCLVGSELLAFQNATLTGANAYNLTTLLRGVYGTQASVSSHASGTSFVRVDNAIFQWNYTNALIGQTVYFKFTSFNIYGSNEESLSAVTAYSHVLSGTPTPAAISLSSETLTQSGVTQTLAASWAADPLAASYVFQYSTNGGSTFTTVALNATSITVEGLGLTSVVIRVAGISSNSVQGPWSSQVTVNGSPINYASAIALNYNDLTSSAMGSLLDQIRNDDAQIVANASASLAGTTYAQSLAKTTNGSVASLTQSQQVTATAQAATAAIVTQLSATSVGVSAGGSMACTASATPSGAYAAWTLSVTATGHATSTAAMTVVANSSGTSSIIFNAAQFAIGNPTTNTIPFQTLAGGGLMLNGVTQINGSIVSQGIGTDGNPYMTMNFGSSPSIVIDDGT